MNILVNAAKVTAAQVTAVAASSSGLEDRTSPSAILARAEEVVEVLRTRHVREGWNMDERASARALEYFRTSAVNGLDDDELRRAAIEFLVSHGQSLDWVFCGNPIGMICGLATASQRASALVKKPLKERLTMSSEERLWAAYGVFERAHEKMTSLDTADARAGSLGIATSKQRAAHKKWERALDAADKAAKRVMSEPAITSPGMLLKIHVAGFVFAAARGSFKMPYLGDETARWQPGPYGGEEAAFIASIGDDLRRTKRTLHPS